MTHISEGDAPENALTAKDGERGAHTDCFYVDLPWNVTLEQFISAFYTTSLFKIERAILSVTVRKPSTDEGALLLAQNKTQSFAAWSVEGRTLNQILLRDYMGKTKSWLMVEAISINATPATRLYFGSVIVPKKVSEDGRIFIGTIFHLFGGFHKVYSRALLRAAYKKLESSRSGA